MSHVEDLLKPRSVEVNHRNCGRGKHAAGYDQITAGTPKRIRVYHRDATVTDGQQATILAKDECDVAKEPHAVSDESKRGLQ